MDNFWGGGLAIQEDPSWRSYMLLHHLPYTLDTILPGLGTHSARKLDFNETLHVGWKSGLRPSVITILQCAASLVTGGYNRPRGPIKSLFPARCLIVRPYANSSELSYSADVMNISSCNFHFVLQEDPD